ncbi:hypothetical protein [Clostridium sp.]|uniref:hypothetical protein n=1 Tax=Clostridium sp. TaxID=1506 RepID=UPI0034647980
MKSCLIIELKEGGINEKDINFSDINYEYIIDKEHLPINFDAKKEILPEKHLMIGSYNISEI